MVIFVLKIVNFRLIFTIIQEIKFGKLFFHSFQHIAHVSWKWDQYWEGGLHVVSWDRAHLILFWASSNIVLSTRLLSKKLPNMRDNLYCHIRCLKLQIWTAIVKEVEYNLLDWPLLPLKHLIMEAKAQQRRASTISTYEQLISKRFSATVIVHKYSSFVAAFTHHQIKSRPWKDRDQ